MLCLKPNKTFIELEEELECVMSPSWTRSMHEQKKTSKLDKVYDFFFRVLGEQY